MTKEKTLSRADLLKGDKIIIEKIEIAPGEFIHVREMSGQGKDIYERAIMKKVKRGNVETYETSLENFKAKLCVSTVCDEKGALLFRPEDHTALAMKMSSKKLEKIVAAAQKINAMDEASKEDILKNSEADQKGNSTSA